MSNIKTYADYARKYADDLYAPYNPTGAFPLDVRGFFENFEDAQEAAKKAVAIGGTGSAYYHGQLIGVLEYPEGLDNPAYGTAAYYIIQPNGILSPIGNGNTATVGLEFSEPTFDDSTQQWYCKVMGLGACKESEIYIPAISPSGAIVNEINEAAFANVHTITKVTLPSTITVIDSVAFLKCSNLETVELQEGLISIGEFAFSQCTKLSKIALPDTVTSIGQFVFFDCAALQEIHLSKNLSNLGVSAFAGCCNLRELMFYEATTIIPASLCKDCLKLTACVFPRIIDLSAVSIFENCSSLNTIYYAGSLEDWINIPKQESSWRKSADNNSWQLLYNSASSAVGTPLTIVYEFADTVYEVNIKLNTKVANLNTNITTLGNNTADKFTSIATKLDTAGKNLLSISEISAEEDSYCLTIDPSAFSSNT